MHDYKNKNKTKNEILFSSEIYSKFRLHTKHTGEYLLQLNRLGNILCKLYTCLNNDLIRKHKQIIKKICKV